MANYEPKLFIADYLDYIFVPCGVLHTFIQQGEVDFEAIAFFTKPDPLPEVSLAISTAFFLLIFEMRP